MPEQEGREPSPTESGGHLVASVVIPAHNETNVIARCLRAIQSQANATAVEVIVVCNGCTDDTAAVASEFSGVVVAEIPQASKIGALNEGDRLASCFPRVYLDADVVLEPGSLSIIVDALRDGAVAAAPLPVLETRGSSLAGRMYFAVWSRLGYARRHLLGSGVYALSESGRRRFGMFLDVIADDGFVYAQFTTDERYNPPGAAFRIWTPRNMQAILRRRIRIYEGNWQLRDMGIPPSDVPRPTWWGVLFREPWLLPSVLLYLYVNFRASRVAVRRRQAGTTGLWNRDDSSRNSGGG